MPEVDGGFAHGLYRVGVEEYAPFLGHFGHGLDGVDVAHLVVGEHDGDNGRIFTHSFRKLVQIQTPFGVHSQIRQLIALLLQMLS